jgi:cytochrome c5
MDADRSEHGRLRKVVERLQSATTRQGWKCMPPTGQQREVVAREVKTAMRGNHGGDPSMV